MVTCEIIEGNNKIWVGAKQATIKLRGRNGISRLATVDIDDLPTIQRHKWHLLTGANGKVYAATYIGKQHIPMHRVITGAPSDMVVDHINNRGLDNRRCNLRVCTHSQNLQNQTVNKNNRTTGIKNVYPAGRDTYRVQIMSNGVMHHVGTYGSIEAATEARDAALWELHGAYARYN